MHSVKGLPASIVAHPLRKRERGMVERERGRTRDRGERERERKEGRNETVGEDGEREISTDQ